MRTPAKVRTGTGKTTGSKETVGYTITAIRLFKLLIFPTIKNAIQASEEDKASR